MNVAFLMSTYNIFVLRNKKVYGDMLVIITHNICFCGKI